MNTDDLCLQPSICFKNLRSETRFRKLVCYAFKDCWSICSFNSEPFVEIQVSPRKLGLLHFGSYISISRQYTYPRQPIPLMLLPQPIQLILTSQPMWPLECSSCLVSAVVQVLAVGILAFWVKGPWILTRCSARWGAFSITAERHGKTGFGV